MRQNINGSDQFASDGVISRSGSILGWHVILEGEFIRGGKIADAGIRGEHGGSAAFGGFDRALIQRIGSVGVEMSDVIKRGNTDE